jgi:hypothetical protein
LITRIIFGDEYRSLSFSLCSFLYSPVTSSFLDPNILLRHTQIYSTSWQSAMKMYVEIVKKYKSHGWRKRRRCLKWLLDELGKTCKQVFCLATALWLWWWKQANIIVFKFCNIFGRKYLHYAFYPEDGGNRTSTTCEKTPRYKRQHDNVRKTLYRFEIYRAYTKEWCGIKSE